MKKIILGIVVLLAVAVLGVWLYADAIASRAVEKGSTYAFGTPTEVGGVRLRLLDASFGMSGYQVSGAEGFRDTPLLSVSDADLEVGYGGLSRQKVVAKRLSISGVRLNLLMKGTSSNFGPVLKHLRTLSGGGSGAESQGPRFVIKEVVLDDVGAHVDVPGLERDLELPTIKLEDVGGEDGVWMSQLAGIILGAVVREAARHGGLPPALNAALGEGLGNLPASLAREARQRVREKVEKETQGLLDKAKQAVEDKDGG